MQEHFSLRRLAQSHAASVVISRAQDPSENAAVVSSGLRLMPRHEVNAVLRRHRPHLETCVKSPLRLKDVPRPFVELIARSVAERHSEPLVV